MTNEDVTNMFVRVATTASVIVTGPRARTPVLSPTCRVP
jgi:hypothetical protein